MRGVAERIIAAKSEITIVTVLPHPWAKVALVKEMQKGSILHPQKKQQRFRENHGRISPSAVSWCFQQFCVWGPCINSPWIRVVFPVWFHCAKKEVAGGTRTRMTFADQKGEKISALEVHRGYNCYFRSYMDDIYIYLY